MPTTIQLPTNRSTVIHNTVDGLSFYLTILNTDISLSLIFDGDTRSSIALDSIGYHTYIVEMPAKADASHYDVSARLVAVGGATVVITPIAVATPPTGVSLKPVITN